MTIFAYRALGANEELVRGEVLAADKGEALRKIKALRFVPIDIREQGIRPKRGRLPFLRPKRVKKEEMMVTLRELAVMLRAGIPILRALRIVIESNRGLAIGDVFGWVYEETKKGESLAASFEKQKKHFSHIIVNMIRTGEKSGRLSEVLFSVSEDLEHSLLVSTEIRNALAYPLFLLTMSGVALFFIFTFVVPRFTAMIAKLDVELPVYSRFVLSTGTFAKDHLALILAGVLLVLVAASAAWKKESIKALASRFVLRIPLVKDFILEVELSRFSHALAVLLDSGVEIINSIGMSLDSMGNSYLRRRFSEVAARLKRGESLHAAIRNVGFFPRLAVNMIEVGEETGKLSEILEEISNLFLQKFRNTMKRMISLLEPAIITVVGVVIGFIVISLLSAIMSMNEIRF